MLLISASNMALLIVNSRQHASAEGLLPAAEVSQD